MLLGRIVGTLVSSRKEEELRGLKLLLVREIDSDLAEVGKLVVAADAVGAGVGVVLSGKPRRRHGSGGGPLDL